MSRRRGAGEGSIYKRRDGRWAGCVQIGFDENGKRRRRTVYARTRAEVVRKLSEIRSAVDTNTLAEPGRIRTGEYLNRWLHDTARPRIRPSTFHHYDRLIRLHAAPCLGGVPLRNLSPFHLQRMQSDLEASGASARLRQMVHVCLHVALKDAVRMGLLARNPVDGVDRPRAPRREIRALDAAQAQALLQAAHGDRLEALYVVAVSTGLRLGELLALRWRDVDVGGAAIHVRRSLCEDVKSGKMTFDEPKTRRASRRVDLPMVTVAALKAHRGRLGATPHPERLVFTDTQGGPIRRSNLHRRSYKPLLAKAGLPPISFHALRHTAASLALAAGVNPKVVQEMLGHCSIALTLDTYSHVIPSLGRDAANRLNAVLEA